MKTILAPIDFSGISDAVVNAAATLARGVDGRVVVFTVVQPPAAVADYAPLLESIAEITAAGERHAVRQLETIEKRLTAAFVTCESAHAIGAPIPQILGEAERMKADYIVMGSHGHTALYDLFVGSTTHGVLTRAKCPVLIVPAAVDAKPARTKPAATATAV